MKKNVKLLILLAIGAIIFNFSSQTYEQQSLVPVLEKLLPGEPFHAILARIEVSYWGQPISIETKGYYYFIEFFIRKFAHLFLFGCLAAALFSVFMMMRPRRLWPVVLFSLLGTAIYAGIDEYHQLLTGGRTPMIKDVFLDICGGMLALGLYVPFYSWREKRKKQSV